MDDNKIVELYWNRDETAIKETKDKYSNYCFTIANKILHNQEDSEEALNDTWLAAWNAMPPHHPLILSTFLGKITRNLSLNKWRMLSADKRGGGQTAVSIDELEECIPDERNIRESLEAEIIAESINDFLGDLKESERKVFVCRYWYFDSIDEIARRYGFTQSKVKMMLKRTRDKLKDYLINEGVIV